MTVQLLNDSDRWDSFIDESSSGLLFHKWDYLTITEKHTGYTLLPYAVYKGEELVCLYPLFYKKRHGLHMVVSPPPLTVIPHLGCIMSREFAEMKQSKKETVLKHVCDEMMQEIASLSPNYLSVTLVPGFHDLRQYIWDGFSTAVHYSYTIDLEKSLDDLWGGLHYKLRSKLKKAGKAGMRLEKSDDLSAFYTLLSERYKDPSLDIPVIDRNYLTDLMHAYPDRIGLYYLYDRDNEVAGFVTTQEYKRFLLWIGTPRLDTTQAGNEYLQWLLIQKAKAEGYPLLENMGANNKDLIFFKSKFNPDLEVYFEISRKDALGRAGEWAYTNLFKKMMMRTGRL
ncbi:GNAT family N-acetyltransferase [Methanoculleus sp. FWC-SCC1]|uniref:GNAT family N-acetyltransferase n=1 Tax=Methanoculleus frigidifontis TaxID=2584085 RepID=A0ABT8MDS6_9EURY|nr:GNAT family N-acetyltransferase [Methanoculleus sp. FWC-SCC1]MDN7026088.1 GNAT family N-acetyltransferase [Methanoculleus sp. FWC-SCC1]